MPKSGTTRIDGRGRLVLPAELRRRLDLRAGDVVKVSEEKGSLRIESRRAAARALVGIAGSVDHSAVDDLRADRRREFEAEDKDSGGQPSDVSLGAGRSHRRS